MPVKSNAVHNYTSIYNTLTFSVLSSTFTQILVLSGILLMVALTVAICIFGVTTCKTKWNFKMGFMSNSSLYTYVRTYVWIYIRGKNKKNKIEQTHGMVLYKRKQQHFICKVFFHALVMCACLCCWLYILKWRLVGTLERLV